MPAVPDLNDARRQTRWRAVHASAGFGVAARVVSVTCTLAQVPIALRLLGAEGFGLWMTLSSLAGLLTLGDLGLGLGAKTLLAETHGKDDSRAFRILADECQRQLLWLALVVALLGVALTFAIDFAAVFKVTDPTLARQLPVALVGLMAMAGLTLASSLGNVLAASLQLAWLQHLSVALGGFLTLLVVLLCAALHASWLALTLWSLALPAIVNVTILVWLRLHLGWRGLSAERLAAEEHGKLRRLSRWFLVPQLGSLFMLAGLPAAIAAAGGPFAVTVFNLLQRIFGLVGQVHWMALSGLWPAYSEAHSRGDHLWIRQAYRRSWLVTCAVFFPGLLALAALTPALVKLWVRDNTPAIAPAWLWVCAGWFGVQLLGQPPALLLNALGRIRTVAVYGTLGHLVSFAAMVVGGKLFGPLGVILGMATGYVAVGLPASVIDASRGLGKVAR